MPATDYRPVRYYHKNIADWRDGACVQSYFVPGMCVGVAYGNREAVGLIDDSENIVDLLNGEDLSTPMRAGVGEVVCYYPDAEQRWGWK